MEYRIEFLTDNIFDFTYPYKINCIGKQISRNTTNNEVTRYFFVSHGRKFQVTENIINRQCFVIKIEEVKEFSLDNEYNSLIFTKDIEYGMKKEIAEEYADMTYHKDGFYIFRDVVMRGGYPYIGGIVDLYEFKVCPFNELKYAIEKGIA